MAVSPSEQTCRSPEFLALQRSCMPLIGGIKMDPNSVCIALVSEGLIPPIVRECCSSSAKLDSEKGQKLFDTIMSHAEIEPAVYHTIMAKLEAYDWLKNCLNKLRRNYEAEKARAVQKAKVHVYGVQKKTQAFDLEVKIEEEVYALDKIPAVDSKIVILETENRFQFTDFVTEMPGFIRQLKNAIIATGPRFTQEQRNVHRLMHDIFSLYDKSAAKIDTCLRILRCVAKGFLFTENTTIEQLLETEHTFSKIASKMQEFALQAMCNFKNVKEKCIQSEKMLTLRRNEECVHVEAINTAIFTLNHFSFITKHGELFWKDMLYHCSILADPILTSQIEKALQYPEEKQLELWTSNGFNRHVIKYYASCVILQKVSNDYIDVIEQERTNLQHSIYENPSIKESRSNLKKMREKMFRGIKRDDLQDESIEGETMEVN